MEQIEVIFEKGNKQGLPAISRIGNTFYMTECSIPQFADLDYLPFFESVKETISKNKNIVIDFKLGYYNSSSNLIIKKLFDLLSDNAYKCRPIVNWYFYTNDELMQEKGEILQEFNNKIQFNLIEFKD